MQKRINSLLLVDDNEATNTLNRALLEQTGFARQIHVASNGFDALDYISGARSNEHCQQPQLILLGGNMPLLDEWGLLAEIERVKWEINFVPIVVMLTSCHCPERRKEALQYEFVLDYLEKPLSKAMIRQIGKRIFFGQRGS